MKRRFLRQLFFFTTLVMVITVLFVTVAMIWLAKNDTNQVINEATINILELIDRQVDNQLERPKRELDSLAFMLQQEFENEDLRELALSEIIQDFHYAEILSENGTIIEVIGEDESRLGFDFSMNEAYRSLYNSDLNYYVGNMQINDVSDEPSLIMGARYNDFYVIGYMDASSFNLIFDELEYKNGFVAIVDSSGTYIAHTENSLVVESATDPFYKLLEQGELEAASTVAYMGGEYVVNSRHTNTSGLSILHYQSTKEFNNAQDRMRNVGIVLSIITVVLALLVLLIMSGKFTNSFQEFFGIITKISAGKYEIERPMMEYREFEGLLNAFMLMSEEIQGREEEIKNLSGELEDSYYQTVMLLAKAIEAKDSYTGNHCERVTKYALVIGELMNLSQENMMELRIGSALHDIGKISIPEQLLNKPGRLSDEEFEIIKTHSKNGYDIIKDLPRMRGAKEVILYHHERYDGNGYPMGLSGEDIPLLARIGMVADSYDAMTSSRLYRKDQMTIEDALAEIERCAGTQFDPFVAEKFCEYIRKEKQEEL